MRSAVNIYLPVFFFLLSVGFFLELKPSSSAFLYSASERFLEAFKMSRWRFRISFSDSLNEALTIQSPHITSYINIIIIICKRTNVGIKFQSINVRFYEPVGAFALNAEHTDDSMIDFNGQSDDGAVIMIG